MDDNNTTGKQKAKQGCTVDDAINTITNLQVEIYTRDKKEDSKFAELRNDVRHLLNRQSDAPPLSPILPPVRTLGGTSQVSAWQPPPSRTTPPKITTATPDAKPRMRIDSPRFNGDDPVGWIFHILKYFDYYCAADADRLQLVGILIDNPASDWFRYYHSNNPTATWMEFSPSIKLRFDKGTTKII